MSSDTRYLPNALCRVTDSGKGVNSDPETSGPVDTKKVPGFASSQLTTSANSDELLLAQVCEGSREALSLLFRRHARAVRNIACRILRDTAEAEDLCQEVFLLLFQKARCFDSSRGKASSWIVQIAYHRAMNRRQYLAHRHHYNAQEFNEEQIHVRRPPLSIDELAAKNLLSRLREQLSEEQRQTLMLHFFEGYSLREIAEKTNQKLGNVRHHFYRGLERIRSILFQPNRPE